MNAPRPDAIATVLRDERQAILDAFVARVRESSIAADHLPRVLILDALPSFLDQLAAALREGEDPGHVLGPSSTTATAVEHGRQRAEVGYEVAEIVREYGLLRDVLLGRLLERGTRFSAREYRILSRHFSAALAEAVDQFARARERERARLLARQFGFLAHELRNKATASLATVEWLRQRIEDPRYALPVGELEATLDELRQLIEHQLQAAKLDAVRAGVELDLADLSVEAVLAAVVRELGVLAERRGVRLVTAQAAGLHVPADERLLRSALANLVGNAVKLSPAGAEVLLAVDGEGDEIVFRVSDSAGGLPEGAQARLFEPFVQGGGAERAGGHGLGLAIARQAVEAQGGRITVENHPGLGCTFRVHLPRTRPT